MPAPERIKDFTVTATFPSVDDFLAIDGTGGGTRKILARSVFIPLGNTVYVDVNGDDETANGSLARPFETVQGALDFITDLADAASSNPYLVSLGVGVFTGNIALIPWTWVKGQTVNSIGINNPSANVWPGGPTIIAGNITYDSSFISGGFVHCGIANMVLSPTHFVDLFLNTGSAGSLTQVSNVFLSDEAFSWRARGNDDLIIVDGIRSPTQAHIAAGSFYLSNSKFFLGLSCGGTNCVGYLIGNTISSNNNAGFPLAFHGSDSDAAAAQYYLSGNLISGFWAVDEDAFCTIYTDVSSLPVAAKRTDSDNQILVLLNDANGVGYTPATPSDWNGSPPTTVSEALDRLAAVALTPP